MTVTASGFTVSWERLPDDYVLPDDPVDNINQPVLAAALTEALNCAGYLDDRTLTTTNYAICATLNNRLVVKGPDWAFIQELRVPKTDVVRSYTPQLQGAIPAIVMEFLSNTEGEEYSVKPTYPPGKWFFYEQVLRVPFYTIFDIETEVLEVYHLNENGRYVLDSPDENGRYWIAGVDLFLGVWYGENFNRSGAWLRWWDADGNLLLWGRELAEQETRRAEQEKQRADRLREKLLEAGIDPDTI